MAVSGMSSSAIFGAVSGGIAVLGVLKTILETASGESFNLQKVAFYVALAAFVIYIVLGVVFTATSALASSEAFADENTALIVGAIVGGALGVYLVLSADWVSYEDNGPGGRAAGAIMGIIVVVGSVFIWNHLKNNEQKET